MSAARPLVSGSTVTAERPLVALTASVEFNSGRHDQPSVFLYTSYIEALESVGLASLLLTPSHSASAVRSIISQCSGLVLSGGEDVDPARYGAAPSPALGSTLGARDEMEFRAIEAAHEYDIPIFAICRGIQVLNVFLGGTLYQDLDSEYATSGSTGCIAHEQTTPWSTRSHAAMIENGSMLRDIVGSGQIATNSFHHQAVKDVAPSLRVVARAEDGVVEAVEGRDGAWTLGVQWHPERYDAASAADDSDRKLFAAFSEVVQRGVAAR